MRIKNIIISLLLFFLAFLFISPVKALTLTQETGVGYYLSSNPNNRVWSTYSTNTSYSFSSLAEIDAVNSRFRYTDGFIKDYTYVITYRITNNYTYSGGNDFLTDWLGLVDTNLGCYYTSSSSVQYTSCFTNLEPISVSQYSTNSITITLTFTPIRDLYQIIYRNELSTSYGSLFYSNGLTISNRSISVVQSSAGAIIDNQNQNTQDIIDNQNQNTQDIIDNQNQNTQDIIDGQKVCTYVDKVNIITDNYVLNSSGNLVSNVSAGVTDYVNINNSVLTVLDSFSYTTSMQTCFYNVNKTLISCTGSLTNGVYTVPVNSYYMRASIIKQSNIPRFKICKNGNQAVSDSLTDSDSSGASSDAENFFGNFTTETYGLTGVITAPLNVIQSITSKTCSPLVLPLPFVNQNLTLPCMGEIYSQYFGDFLTIYQTITFGIVAYWVVVRIFNLVKDFKNPDHDEVEVLDL